MVQLLEEVAQQRIKYLEHPVKITQWEDMEKKRYVIAALHSVIMQHLIQPGINHIYFFVSLYAQ